MTRSTINPGACGFQAQIQVRMDGDQCAVSIQSGCPAIQRLCKQLGPLDPMGEITYRGEGPRVLRVAATVLPHTSCPVPPAIIKTIEVAAGLALPAEVRLQVEKTEGE